MTDHTQARAEGRAEGIREAAEVVKCSECKEEKCASDYYFRKDMQALSKRCKRCTLNAQAERIKRPEVRLKISETRKLARAKGCGKERGRRHARNRAEKYPEKEKARRVVRTAIEKGLIERPSACNKCGSNVKRQDGVTAVQAHHSDYSKPLDVEWLCVWCHAAEHRALSGDRT
jgi:hypothetical protein